MTRTKPPRRSVTASVKLVVQPIDATPIETLARNWRTIFGEEADLAREWDEMERWLVKYRKWAKLSDADRGSIPEGKELLAMETRLSQLEERREAVLAALSATPASTVGGILSKLRILIDIASFEQPAAKVLLDAVVQELEVTNAVTKARRI